jgi:hypothetical protein
MSTIALLPDYSKKYMVRRDMTGSLGSATRVILVKENTMVMVMVRMMLMENPFVMM